MDKNYCLVMAGGKGTRFWPESTSKKPKQYLSLLGDNTSLLSKTLNRFEGLVMPDDRFIVTVREQKELVLDSAENQISKDGVIFEPAGRNTGPCILLSLIYLLKNGADENDLVSIVPSDHVILNEKGFQNSIRKGFKLASETQSIVTIGIRPHFPHTGYGYIKRGKSSGEGYEVEEFREKPDFQTAKTYLASGDFYWNAGMFMAPIRVLMSEFKNCSPELYQFVDLIKDSFEDEKKIEETYLKMPEISIDYAVMEKSKLVKVLEAEFDWNDLGSWEAMESVIEPTENNTLIKQKGHYLDNSTGNIVYAPNKFVSLVNIKDLIVVVNDDVLMVLPKEDSQKVKEIVGHIKQNKDESLLSLI